MYNEIKLDLELGHATLMNFWLKLCQTNVKVKVNQICNEEVFKLDDDESKKRKRQVYNVIKGN